MQLDEITLEEQRSQQQVEREELSYFKVSNDACRLCAIVGFVQGRGDKYVERFQSK